MARKSTKTVDNLSLLRSKYNSWARTTTYTKIPASRLAAIQTGRATPTRSEISRITHAVKKSEHWQLTLPELAKATNTSITELKRRSKTHKITGGIIRNDGKVYSVSKGRITGEPYIAYTVTNTHTGEVSIYWGDFDALIDMMDSEFSTLYLDDPKYSVQIVHI